jgi:hypothetical protein
VTPITTVRIGIFNLNHSYKTIIAEHLENNTSRDPGTMKLPTIYNVHLVAIIATLGGAL